METLFIPNTTEIKIVDKNGNPFSFRDDEGRALYYTDDGDWEMRRIS